MVTKNKKVHDKIKNTFKTVQMAGNNKNIQCLYYNIPYTDIPYIASTIASTLLVQGHCGLY